MTITQELIQKIEEETQKTIWRAYKLGCLMGQIEERNQQCLKCGTCESKVIADNMRDYWANLAAGSSR